jgi:hypothetical protein
MGQRSNKELPLPGWAVWADLTRLAALMWVGIVVGKKIPETLDSSPIQGLGPWG